MKRYMLPCAFSHSHDITEHPAGTLVSNADAEAELASRDAALASLQAELKEAREMIREAREDIDSWAGYASEYFQEKHDLKGTLARYDAFLSKGSAK